MVVRFRGDLGTRQKEGKMVVGEGEGWVGRENFLSCRSRYLSFSYTIELNFYVRPCHYCVVLYGAPTFRIILYRTVSIFSIHNPHSFLSIRSFRDSECQNAIDFLYIVGSILKVARCGKWFAIRYFCMPLAGYFSHKFN